MIINPFGSQNQALQMNAVQPQNKVKTPAAQPAQAQTLKSPDEKSEPAAEEAREKPTQEATEALRTLASREPVQLPEAAPKMIMNVQTAQKAYQNFMQ